MASGNYTYNPVEIKEPTVSRMRFELGDTMVEGKAETALLTDEEVSAAIETYPSSWKRAKLMLVESLFRRFSHEVTTKTGPLTLNLSDRANLWKAEYEKLKREVELESVSIPAHFGKGRKKPPYFYTGMQENERSRG